MPCQRSLTLSPREAEYFPRGGNYFKHMPLLTYLAWLQPIYHDCKFVFKHVKPKKKFGENFNKKHKAAATLINTHKSED